MLTKEPEMLQPDAFCEHTMQQNATAAPPARSPRHPSWFKGGLFVARRGEGREVKGKGGEAVRLFTLETEVWEGQTVCNQKINYPERTIGREGKV